jgi:hypothetical protein
VVINDQDKLLRLGLFCGRFHRVVGKVQVMVVPRFSLDSI